MRVLAAVVVVVVVVVASACGGTRPIVQPAAEIPVKTIGDVAGHWVTSDDMDWGYMMTIEPAGSIQVMIDRNKLGRCEQKGTAVAGSTPATFLLTYAVNACNHEYNGAAIEMKIASFTGKSLTLVLAGEGIQERHTYTRDPKFSEAASKPGS